MLLKSSCVRRASPDTVSESGPPAVEASRVENYLLISYCMGDLGVGVQSFVRGPYEVMLVHGHTNKKGFLTLVMTVKFNCLW